MTEIQMIKVIVINLLKVETRNFYHQLPTTLALIRKQKIRVQALNC